jgi:predicted transposase YbfD/YdcC
MVSAFAARQRIVLGQVKVSGPGLYAVVVVESRREINGKMTAETRFYITSLVMLAAAVGPMIRSHWPIENSLHWVWTWSFATTNAASEPTTPQPISQRHIAYNLTRKAPGKDSIRLRRKTAGWDDEYLASLIAPHDYFHPIPLRPAGDGIAPPPPGQIESLQFSRA